MVKDNTGTLEPRFNYAIFGRSDSSKGVMPGETYTLPEGGFFLPQGCTATTAIIEITKVQEYSGF